MVRRNESLVVTQEYSSRQFAGGTDSEDNKVSEDCEPPGPIAQALKFIRIMQGSVPQHAQLLNHPIGHCPCRADIVAILVGGRRLLTSSKRAECCNIKDSRAGNRIRRNVYACRPLLRGFPRS
jgi:hypothetical protein